MSRAQYPLSPPVDRSALSLSLSCTLLFALPLAPAARAAEPQAPPNRVAVTECIVTSGQPSAAWLAIVKTPGIEAVIHLAPPTVHDAIHDEALIVGRQGLVFEQGLASSANGSGRATRNTAARVTLRRQKMKAGAPAGTSRRTEPRCGQSRHVRRARAVPAARQARPRARWAGWHAARTDHSVH